MVENKCDFEDLAKGRLSKILNDLHSETWASQEYVNGVIHSKTGALAGTSAADLMFTPTISRLMKK